ncbi:Pachytene checkpoint protein 2 [Chytridiales sp. JEL 0842]|nr:Pachytene checkpoint protein 2 [Chytridiales sp. JEL 0842]
MDGLWESLIFDHDIMSKLLSYVSTALLFADRAVNPHLISFNKVILLHGPPGTGKTSLCRALSQKLSIRLSEKYTYLRLVEINSHSLFSKFFSESGKLVMKMFQSIKDLCEDQETFVCVLIDEVESLTAARKAAVSGMEPSDAIRVVNALLTQIGRCMHLCGLQMEFNKKSDALHLAFIDRADLKQFIGLPTKKVVYAMLCSTLRELMRCKLIFPEVPLIDWRAIELFSQNVEDEVDPSPSDRLFSLSAGCLGFSGRTIRKLPFLTHALFLKSRTSVNMTEYLDALELTIKEERNATRRPHSARADTAIVQGQLNLQVYNKMLFSSYEWDGATVLQGVEIVIDPDRDMEEDKRHNQVLRELESDPDYHKYSTIQVSTPDFSALNKRKDVEKTFTRTKTVKKEDEPSVQQFGRKVSDVYVVDHMNPPIAVRRVDLLSESREDDDDLLAKNFTADVSTRSEVSLLAASALYIPHQSDLPISLPLPIRKSTSCQTIAHELQSTAIPTTIQQETLESINNPLKDGIQICTASGTEAKESPAVCGDDSNELSVLLQSNSDPEDQQKMLINVPIQLSTASEKSDDLSAILQKGSNKISALPQFTSEPETESSSHLKNASLPQSAAKSERKAKAKLDDSSPIPSQKLDELLVTAKPIPKQRINRKVILERVDVAKNEVQVATTFKNEAEKSPIMSQNEAQKRSVPASQSASKPKSMPAAANMPAHPPRNDALVSVSCNTSHDCSAKPSHDSKSAVLVQPARAHQIKQKLTSNPVKMPIDSILISDPFDDLLELPQPTPKPKVKMKNPAILPHVPTSAEPHFAAEPKLQLQTLSLVESKKRKATTPADLPVKKLNNEPSRTTKELMSLPKSSDVWFFPWTKQDDARLLDIAKSAPDHPAKWEMVADEMINRSATECLQRYAELTSVIASKKVDSSKLNQRSHEQPRISKKQESQLDIYVEPKLDKPKVPVDTFSGSNRRLSSYKPKDDDWFDNFYFSDED